MQKEVAAQPQLDALPLDDIVEVVNTGWRNTNKLLAAGYRLLHIDHQTEIAKKTDGQEYVKHYSTFICGRTADIERLDLTAPKPAAS